MDTLIAAAKQSHATCWVCGHNPLGLNLRFVPSGKTIAAAFCCDEAFAGYDGIVHGGIVASLLDGAMTNCLLHQGVTAVTAELTVRYGLPLQTGHPALVRAWVTDRRGDLWILQAQVQQGSSIRARATAKFLATSLPGRDQDPGDESGTE